MLGLYGERGLRHVPWHPGTCGHVHFAGSTSTQEEKLSERGSVRAGITSPKNARSLSYALRAVPRPSTRPARPALEIMSHPSERSPPPPRFSSCLPAALKPGRTLLCPSRRPRPVRRNLHGPPPRSRARPQAMRRKLPGFRAPNQMALFPHPRSESFFLLKPYRNAT